MRGITLSIYLVVLCGCISPSIKHYTYGDDGALISKTIVSSTKYPAGDSYVFSTNGVVEARLSASQDAKLIIGATGQSRNMLVMYVMCGLIVLVGIGCFAAPNHIISNKDALIICGIGGVGFAVVTWVSAAAPIMKFVIPVVAVGALFYFGYQWMKKK